MKKQFTLMLAVCFMLIGFCNKVVAQSDSTIIIGGDIKNGNFNNLVVASEDDKQMFYNVVDWKNLGDGEMADSTEATRTNLTYDEESGRNAVITGFDTSRIFTMNTGHTILEEESYDVSYVWRDAWNWNDANSKVVVRLFVTDNNTMEGVVTVLVVDSSELSTQDGKYEMVDHNSIYTAKAEDAGKTLFVQFQGSKDDLGGFARLDNFELVSKGGKTTDNINEISVNKLEVFPNPVEAVLTLKNVENGNKLVKIYNIQGQCLYNETLETNEIEVSNLTPGVYTIILHTGTQSYASKFIKR